MAGKRMKDESSLQNRTALVTGASSGIGAATAIALARAGADVLIHYNTGQSAADAVLQQVRRQGVGAVMVQADLATAEGVRTLARFAEERTIDILVNNASSPLARTRGLDFPQELWERVFMSNLTSAFFLSQAVLRGMVERRRGYIVNVSSVAARNSGGLGALAYATVKGALSTMTKGLTREFAPYGIRVNAVSPGTVDTNYHRTFSTAEGCEIVRAETPAGSLGSAEDIADTIVFLCSEGARFIQGQVVEINGEFLMA